MKYIVALFALMLVATAFAEPIYHDQDSRDVTVYIADWVYIDFDGNYNGLYLDVEAGQTGANGSLPFTYGRNCPARITGNLVIDGPVTPSWSFASNGLQQIDLQGTGVGSDAVNIAVGDVDISDPAGTYHGTMTIAIDSLNTPD